MVKVNLGDDIVQSSIKFKVRFDFKGINRPRKFLFGNKPIEQIAEETREEQITLLKNIPIQGVYFEDYDISMEPYVIFDETIEEKVAFAPALLTIRADSVEDMICFIMRREFRTIEVLEPPQMILTGKELEKILFKMNEELREQLFLFSRKIRR